MSLMLNELAKEIHTDNIEAGWWDDCINWTTAEAPLGYGKFPLNIAGDHYLLSTKLCLIHSEVSEMMEGLRKGQPDDHLPHRSMEEVEAADVFIRLLDYCGARGIDIDGAMAEKRAYNKRRADHKLDARNASNGKKF